LGSWIYCRLRRLPFASLADLGAPGIILAQAIGRVGCIINGCCYGKETSLPWGFVYTHPDSNALLGTSIHPTHLYELLGDLVIFALLFWVFRGRLRPSGSLLALYLALYSVLTFTVRFWRGDTETFAGPIHEGQLISMIVFLLAVGWLVVNRTHWVKRQPEQVPVHAEETPVEGSPE
jgi:phosphatidylglycerol:prolipoprotein diacylglycerol transferase